jgi:hypothetical protein
MRKELGVEFFMEINARGESAFVNLLHSFCPKFRGGIEGERLRNRSAQWAESNPS